MAYNVEALAMVGNFGIQKFSPCTMLNSSNNVQLTTSAPILAMQCYAFALFFIADVQ